MSQSKSFWHAGGKNCKSNGKFCLRWRKCSKNNNKSQRSRLSDRVSTLGGLSKKWQLKVLCKKQFGRSSTQSRPSPRTCWPISKSHSQKSDSKGLRHATSMPFARLTKWKWRRNKDVSVWSEHCEDFCAKGKETFSKLWLSSLSWVIWLTKRCFLWWVEQLPHLLRWLEYASFSKVQLPMAGALRQI